MQSLQRIRDRDEIIHELGQALEQSPRKYKLRRANSNFDYRSNHTGNALVDGEAVDPQDRLRRIRSNDTVIFRPPTRPKVTSATPRPGTESALGFREAEICDEVELGGLSALGTASLQDRSEQTSSRPHRFSKSRSVEKWRDAAGFGIGWLKGG